MYPSVCSQFQILNPSSSEIKHKNISHLFVCVRRECRRITYVVAQYKKKHNIPYYSITVTTYPMTKSKNRYSSSAAAARRAAVVECTTIVEDDPMLSTFVPFIEACCGLDVLRPRMRGNSSRSNPAAAAAAAALVGRGRRARNLPTTSTSRGGGGGRRRRSSSSSSSGEDNDDEVQVEFVFQFMEDPSPMGYGMASAANNNGATSYPYQLGSRSPSFNSMSLASSAGSGTTLDGLQFLDSDSSTGYDSINSYNRRMLRNVFL